MEAVSSTREKGQDQCSLKARDMIFPFLSLSLISILNQSITNFANGAQQLTR